jgi:diguanylate cyclase (GGDEF)-like protein
MQNPNSAPQSSNGTPSAVSGPRDTGRDAADAPRLFAEAVNLRRALAASERRLGAALQQVSSLQTRDEELTKEAITLTETAASARRFACHDDLTGLINRHLLMDRFSQAVALAARDDKHVALLFLDLDRFKHINTTLGHSAGDIVLRQAAARLTGCIRRSDTACRYEGDEFVLLLPEVAGREGAAVVAEKIRVQLALPYAVDGTTIAVTTSIGIAVYPVDGRGYGDLIHAADVAMYRDKARCPPSPIIFDRAPDAIEPRRREASISRQAGRGEA